jgi:hypothetical protein
MDSLQTVAVSRCAHSLVRPVFTVAAVQVAALKVPGFFRERETNGIGPNPTASKPMALLWLSAHGERLEPPAYFML